MSGVAGIIDFNKENLQYKENFSSFIEPLWINKSNEHKILSKNTVVHIGIFAIDDKQVSPKYYSEKKYGIHLFINGNVFLKKDVIVELSRKYSLNSNQNEEFYLLYLYLEKGEELTDFLSGDFVVVIYDDTSPKVIVLNSHFGMLPLFYTIQNNTLIFSSRLQSFIKLKGFNTEINPLSLLDYVLFNYPIGNNSFLKNVYMLEAGTIISTISGSGIHKRRYWNTDHLFENKRLKEKDSIDLIDSTFSEVVSKMTARIPNVFSALTGGWDGRLLLTFLAEEEKENKLNFFSFGRKGFKDITIPQSLCETFGFIYFPVYLDEDFIEDFERWAMHSIEYSDGLRSLSRAHYLFGAAKMGEETNHFLSGNCASNLLKIVTSPTPAYNINIFKLIQKDDIKTAAKDIYREFISSNKIIKQLSKEEEFIDNILRSDIVGHSREPKAIRFYRYLLTNSERKYFGIEAASYSSFVYNLMPFIDVNFVSAISKTPFFGGHYKFADQNFFRRQKLIKLYAHLMVKKNKQIASYPTDRGFPITNFLSWNGLIKGFLAKKTKYKQINAVQDPYCLKEGINKIFANQQLNSVYFFKNSIDYNSMNHEIFQNIHSLNLWINQNKL